MNQKLKKNAAADYVRILVGTFIMAFAINALFEPMNLVTGGVSGIAIIVKKLTGLPLWLTTVVLNIPLFFFAVKIKGAGFLARTLAATLALSAFLGVIPGMVLLKDDLFLTAIFGGVLTGVGLGLVLSSMATTGGTDLLAVLIQRYLKHYSVAEILQVLDGTIVLAGAFIFGIQYALYAVLAVFIISKVSDSIIEGTKFAKQAYVISGCCEEIAEQIMQRLDRGVTGLRATGMYSNEDKTVLYCVVSKKEIVQLKDIVEQIDPNAFVIVSDAREVLGEGFREFRQ